MKRIKEVPNLFWVWAAKHRRLLKLLVKVLICILIALLFLIAVFDSRFGKVLSCLGVIVCCSLASVLTDRHFWR